MIRRFLADQRGVAAVEAALLTPCLLAATVFAADAGKALVDRHQMKAGLMAGARLLARAGDPTQMESQARNLVVTGAPSGGKARIAGWRADQVTISYRMIANASDAYAGGGSVRVIRLQSAMPYTGFGLVRFIGLQSLTLGAAHEERWTGG